jgi:tripartite-type tricarboxylate transporter receptor subunit TctC
MNAFARIVVLALLFMPAIACGAEKYPTKSVTIVVPFPPASNPDIIARAIQNKMSESLGVPVVIENRPGAGGNIGSAAAARAPADGSTILLGSINTLTMNPWIYKDMPFDPATLVPIVFLGPSPNVLVVHPSVKANNVRELIELAKAKPGTMSYATPGVGTSLHLSGELFKSMSGTDIVHIPSKGGVDAITDVLAGRIELSFANFLPMINYIRDGRLRALAVTSKERQPLLPDVPTMNESGLSGYEAAAWVGLVGPAGTPRIVVEQVNAAANTALRDPSVAEKLKSLGMTIGGGSPEEFGALIASESVRWKKTIEDAKIGQ